MKVKTKQRGSSFAVHKSMPYYQATKSRNFGFGLAVLPYLVTYPSGPLDLIGVLTGDIWGFSGGALGPAYVFTGDCSGGDWELGGTTWEEGTYGASSCCRASKFSRSRFWKRRETSSISAVLLSFSFHNVWPWLQSRLLDNAYFLVQSVSLKLHDLLWTERKERFGMLIMIWLLLLLVFKLWMWGDVPGVECFRNKEFPRNRKNTWYALTLTTEQESLGLDPLEHSGG